MKSIGSILFLFGVAAIVLGFMDRVPAVLEWIYGWGETTAWAIKNWICCNGCCTILRR